MMSGRTLLKEGIELNQECGIYLVSVLRLGHQSCVGLVSALWLRHQWRCGIGWCAVAMPSVVE